MKHSICGQETVTSSAGGNTFEYCRTCKVEVQELIPDAYPTTPHVIVGHTWDVRCIEQGVQKPLFWPIRYQV